MRLLTLLIIIIAFSCQEKPTPAPSYSHEKYEMPEEKYGFFYKEIMMMNRSSEINFNNAIPKGEVRDIINAYRRAKNDIGFTLDDFLREHFIIPEIKRREFKYDSLNNIDEHIASLWAMLRRPADKKQVDGSTLIPLSNPHMVNMASSIDITYWDGYFMMLGLKEKKDTTMMQDMVDNYAAIIDLLGYIPIGNRTYLATMSQPPFFTSMVELLAEEKGEETMSRYLPQIGKEYDYWMRMSDVIDDNNVDSLKVVKVGNHILNRYRDENPNPRYQHYTSDINLSMGIEGRNDWEVQRELRGASESGMNFTGRWFENRRRRTVMTSEVLPVDLNTLLYHMEATLASLYKNEGKDDMAAEMNKAAENRKTAINTIFWDANTGIYDDYNYGDSSLRDKPSLAMMFPLFFGLASQAQADSIVSYMEENLLFQGGVASSIMDWNERWDYPNGWPHLHWITVKGLERYGYNTLAKEIATRWVKLAEKTYRETGRFLEYYDVVETGENEVRDNYPRDGYGPTIGVYLALKSYAQK